ncbi:MAG: hypothetical protein ACLPVF_17310 [Acidimicrobiales bacterium]
MLATLVALLVVLATVGGHAPAAQAATNGVGFRVAVNGQPAATSSDARPAQVYATGLTNLRIVVSNHTGSTVRVATVRYEGTVVGLPLFSYDSAVGMVVPPGRVKALTFPITLSGIGSQATGLVAATITLLGPNGDAIASQALVTKVHGSLISIYGLFGLAVLALTISSLVLALIAMARHTLPENRWLRGLRFAIPGFGVGLVLTFTMSVFNVFTPGQGKWLPLLVVTTVTGFALGYLTPAPNEEEYDDYDDDVLLAQIVVLDEDPLESANGSLSPAGVTTVDADEGGSRITRPSFVPDSRPTGDPEGRPSGVPDSRPTGVPDSRPTGDPQGRPSGVPDSRPTGDPQGRPSGVPDSRPTGDPQGRPTGAPDAGPPAGPDGRPTIAP